ncbi:inhibitor of nuclear factor kappa-B kinase subunit epsilon isoform X1 [Megalops cyprinoides]|uniref:inhibitor of nuclear factor kappa-B kinase subunit epsilon isoform X1 n=1 Tax=Megalops cyprinoides TaxID=118141 RepID=UPI001863A52A|nr:inhibitor of nuclear factor kappa-B kinase subunit epsilon isoform X1 [Megalops cyprinoides]XP_036387810.1 inhibitor of nuclear factor kappa-B kinase subunit epsilon isoform X1 [Megalops cyprinoides]XP_036387811.1 inhibitor of nuclear factor kappa-B kinase subunit epsilon isoform X1 [Megalops cyprinoides]
MMASTANYLWSMEDVLGQGATASVFKARNKKTGELVAVKVFNTSSYGRPYEVQIREFEMLRKLNHVNIVKLFAVEEGQMHLNTKQKVLVMEFCSGGSLLNLLEEPENAFGLPESEFLIVLQCVVHGMNHLRENGVVHRDIKPGNIMRLVGEDGRSVYKLTDFGAARELEDDEKFVSIYGTEEYLHPDMYERAVLRKPQQKAYGVTVDLWSIGVTFYHAAAGTLPFVPFGGPRKNKQIMYKITTEKPVGAIAGVQKVEDGVIEWSYHLPHCCQLSEGLKTQLVPVLASILEADQEKCWGFDQFFAETTGILHRVAIHVFSLQQATAHHVYIPSYNTASIFFKEVQRQTGVVPELQQYMFQGHLLFLDSSMTVVSFPQTTPDRPIFLISRQPERTVGLLHREPETLVMPSRFDVVADFAFTKGIVGVIHQYLRIACSLRKSQELILQGFYAYFENVRTECGSTVHKISIINMKVIACLKMEEKLHKLSHSTEEHPDRTENGKQLRVIQENLPMYANRIREFQSKLDHLHAELSSRSEILAQDRSTEKMEFLLEKISEVHQQYRKDRMTGKLAYNDEQIHKFEKINLSNNIKKVKSIYRDDCLQKYHDVLAVASNWTSALHEMQSQLKEFGNAFNQLIGDLQACEERQNKILDAVLFRAHQGVWRPESTDELKEKDHMILRMNRLKDEMEAVARELQCNNSIIESLGSMSIVPGV